MRPDEFAPSAPGEVVRSVARAANGELYWTFQPASPPPAVPLDMGLAARLSEADRALGELAGVGRMLPNPHLLIRPFISREAVLSSRIEGTVTNLNQLFLFEAEPDDLRHPADAGEVFNYVRATEFGLAQVRAGYPFSLGLLRELHRLLMTGVRGEDKRPGEVRDRPVFIGRPGQSFADARFVPPCHTRLAPLLDDFVRFLRDERTLPPVVQLALMHYQFETIHPFNDGNGRVGRLLITLLLCERQVLPQPLLYLSAYFEQHRQAYYDHLLEVSRRAAWGEWVGFVAAGVTEQARDAARRAGRLLDLRQEYQHRAADAVRSPAALKIVDELFASPYLTAHRVVSVAGVTRAAAQNSIDKLAAAGLLREITGKTRNRVYCADAVLRLLDQPLADDPPAGQVP